LVMESASSRMIILKGGQGWPLCGCVGVKEEGCVCMVVRGKGGEEMGVRSTVQKPKAQNGSRINVLLLCSIQ